MTGASPDTLTQWLAEYLRSKPVVSADRQAAAVFTLDTIANALAGQRSDPGQRILRWRDSNLKSAGDAGRLAFVMGALSHILETDDLHRASVVHPGCVVVPAAWATALETGADGPAFLTAVVRGYEAAARIGMAVGSGHYKIWHNTATCGPFGAAAAASSLYGLDSAALVDALGNAGTQSSGLWQFLETGAMSKHLHAGRAAESGWMAASLARFDFTGPPAILEGSRGLFAGTCPDPVPDRLSAQPEAPWQVHQTSIKPWPCCRHTHPAIDAGREIAAGLGTTREIDRVLVETYEAALDVCNRPGPTSPYEAQFSLQHCVAAALALPQVDFSAFDTGARERLSQLRSAITVRTAPRFNMAYPQAWGCTVTVYLRNGRQVSASRTHAKGDPEAPLSHDELADKASMLMKKGGIESPAPLIQALLDLPNAGALPGLPGLTA